MRTLILAVIFTTAAFAQGGSYRITDSREVVSECYDYSFRLPDKWYISVSNPTPYFFNFSPKLLGTFNIGVPAGGAEISIVKDSHEVGTIDKWIELDRTARGFSSTRYLHLSPDTTITRAVEAVSIHDEGITNAKLITRTTAVYFEFQKQAFGAFLRYNSNDPNGGKFESTLMAVLQSFRPLSGPLPNNCGCSKQGENSVRGQNGVKAGSPDVGYRRGSAVQLPPRLGQLMADSKFKIPD